jgi:hypothetical protein
VRLDLFEKFAVGVEISNAAGAVKNTQHLGAEVIRSIEASRNGSWT